MKNFLKIKKNDTVKIIAGKDLGKSGKVLKSIPKNGRVLVEGINLYKKNVRPKNANEKGQTISVPRSIHISNLQIICPSCGKSSRIGFRVVENTKERFCKKCLTKI